MNIFDDVLDLVVDIHKIHFVLPVHNEGFER